MWLLGGVADTGSYVGAGALLLALFGYLFKELRRKDDGVWQIIADKDKEIERLRGDLVRATEERDFWRGKRLGEADFAWDEEMRRHD